MVNNFKIFISAHGAATVVFFLANDVNFANIKRIGRADDRANVKIVFNVFDSNFEASTGFIQSLKNLLVRETFVFIDEVTGVFHISNYNM